MKRSDFLKAAALTGFAGFVRLGSPAQAQAQGATSTQLRAGLKLSPTSMDPHFRLSGEQSLLRAIHSRLVGMTSAGKPEPGIAESWRTIGDGRIWEFKLRGDAKFSDGSPVTAEDVAFSLWRIPRIEGSRNVSTTMRQTLA